MSLPRCDLTELPRVLCHHCETFTMTDTERAFLATVDRWGEPPALPIRKRDQRPGTVTPEPERPQGERRGSDR